MSKRRNRRPVEPASQPTPPSDMPAAAIAARGSREGIGGSTPAAPTRVSVVHTKRDYLVQSVLIVFSVLLALALSELSSAIRERRQTDELLANVRAELMRNQTALQEMHGYNLTVLRNIEAALADPTLQRAIVTDGEFKLARIAPDGVLFRYLDSSAWEAAKSRNIATKISVSAWSRLTRIYEDQARIMKLEDEVARIILAFEARKTENVRQTLLLIGDNYRGWATDRAPGLLRRYGEAIDVRARP